MQGQIEFADDTPQVWCGNRCILCLEKRGLVERSIRKAVSLLELSVQLMSISLPEMIVPVNPEGAAGTVLALGL